MIQSADSLGNPLEIVYASSNFVGSATGGNVISSNHGDGVHIVGVGANRNLVQGNYIGVGPRADTRLAGTDPGNLGDGVRIEDGSQNQIGGELELGNTIASNRAPASTSPASRPTGNVVSYNMIGMTASGGQVLGNCRTACPSIRPATRSARAT